jgi:hypothetical protein
MMHSLPSVLPYIRDGVPPPSPHHQPTTGAEEEEEKEESEEEEDDDDDDDEDSESYTTSEDGAEYAEQQDPLAIYHGWGVFQSDAFVAVSDCLRNLRRCVFVLVLLLVSAAV